MQAGRLIQIYGQVMDEFRDKLLPEGHPLTQFCIRVVERLGPATGVQGVDWKVHVIDDDVPNAFVIPGGQIFIFTVFPFPTNLPDSVGYCAHSQKRIRTGYHSRP
jgi:metalloendopeptidase OMA1, mitochondrial